jgi:hypothetical protein
MSEHSESLDVEIDEVEVLDPIDTSSDDTMESESVHSDRAYYDFIFSLAPKCCGSFQIVGETCDGCRP